MAELLRERERELDLSEAAAAGDAARIRALRPDRATLNTFAKDGFFPLVLGGDHSLAAGSFSGVANFFREQGKMLVSEGGLFIPHAHTVCVDPDTNLVYFPLQNIDGHPVLRIMEPAQSH